MKKLIIVALGVCILGTACSRDNNLAEKNTLQQPLEQSVMLQTEEIEIQSTKESSSEQEIILLSEEPAETVSLSEPEHMEGSAAASVEERDRTKTDALHKNDTANNSSEVTSENTSVLSSGQADIPKSEQILTTKSDNFCLKRK